MAPMTARREQLIDRLVLNIMQAEERGDRRSAAFLNRCLVAAVKASEQPAYEGPRVPMASKWMA